MPLLLMRHLDRRTEWKVLVGEDSFSIGCSEAATVPVPDPTIASKEVLISRRGDRFFLKDLAAKGRVFLGGKPVREGLLKSGDKLRIGRIAVLFFEHERSGQGQIDLFREEVPDAIGPDPLEAVRRFLPPPPRRPVGLDLPRKVWLGVVSASFAAGLLLVIFLPTHTPEASNARGPQPKTPRPQAKALDAALKDLKDELEKPKAAPAPEPSQPERFALGPIEDPMAARILISRMFIDIIERPPTRSELRELTPLGHEQAWRRISEAAASEGRSARSGWPLDEAWRSLLGRLPDDSEREDFARLATPERPAAFWITAGEEYRRATHRRPRGDAVRSRSLIVDLLDRLPASAAEEAAVAAAIREGGQAQAARVLALSSQSKLPPADAAATTQGKLAWWEEELARFLSRPPTAAERARLPAALKDIPPGQARRWLCEALAAHEDYGSY